MYLRPQGHGILCDPSLSQSIVTDTFTCGHCQYIVQVKPLQSPEDMGGLCKVCMSLVCPQCYADAMKGGGCKPWEKRMEEMEAKAKFLSSVGLE